jgi:hypothetical protein
MNPRTFSTKDRERFGGTSRTSSRSSGLGPRDLGSEPDDEHVSGREDGSSTASVSGLAAFDPTREPVDDEHWETTIGESNKPSGLGTSDTTPTCSTLVIQSNASAKGTTLSGRALREILMD